MQEIELISKRNLREKHFLKKNGLIEAKIYDQNVHYLKNGTFEEIDNTLLEENEEYVNKANSYKVHFTKNLKKYLMKIERENYYIEVSLSTQNKFKLKKEVNKEKSISNIVYQNIFKGVNIRYSLLPNHVKEYITLNNKEFDTNNLVFVLKTNLKLVENEDRSINVVEGTNIIFTLNSPYMTDKNGIVNDNVFYKFDYKDNQYILKLVVDQEWLKSETTKYPVNIDPTITNYGESNNVYDTYIFPNDSSVDRNNREYLKVGVENTNGFNTINRALIKFELPTIGTGSQIIEANLNLRGYPDFTHSYTTDFVNVYRITTDWNETDANWNSMNNKYDSRVEGTFESNRIYYIDSDGNISLSTCGCDITNIVKKWYSDYPNYGIMLKLNNEVYKTDVIPMFFSKNNSISGGNPKPLLSIVYRNQNGLEDYMYYQEQIFTIGKTYHNIYNGNLTSVFNIGSTISGKMPINLKIIYNTNDVVLNNNYGYGIGYRLNLLQTIQEEIIENITYLKYIDSDGTIHYFSNQRVKYDETSGYFITAYENTFFDEDGLDLTIERDNTDYILIDKNNNQMKFSIDNKIGYLSSIIDVSGNKNTIYYDSNHKIIKIVDANNSEISINYSTNLISVISPDQTISLNYSNNNLISIVSILGTTSFINTNNLITSIIDITGKKISYEYYSQSPYRIKKIEEYGINNSLGKNYMIEYGFNSSSITDSLNKVKTITFNNYGNPISISSLKSSDDIMNAYGMSLKYGETDNGVNTYNNKLLENEIPLKYVKNYFQDPSFENENYDFIKESNIDLGTTSEYANIGFKSLYVYSLEFGKKIYKNFSVPKGNCYTFSAFIRTEVPIRMSLSYLDEGSNTIEILSNSISSFENFERYDISINYPSTAMSDLKASFILEGIGYSYIDDVQLERGEVVNNYNILENSDFSDGLYKWTLSVRDRQTGSEISSDNVFEVVNINDTFKSLKINMNPIYFSNCSQFLGIRGKAGDIYNLSFWYKNEGLVSHSEIGGGSQNNVIFNFIPINEQHNDQVYNKTFNPNEREWQYFSFNFTAQWDFKEIRLSFTQSLNANSTYITNINLFKDVRSITYSYDELGNVIFSKNLDNKSTQLNYDKNNELIKMTDPKGKNFVYEYDNTITDRVLKGISETSISNEYIYDSFGNPILTKITNRGLNKLDVSKNYRIRLKGTDKDLGIINDNLFLEDDNCGHNKWMLEKVTVSDVDYYKIYHSILTEKFITVSNNKVIIGSYQNDNSLFILSKNDNGSYFIKSKLSDTYLKYNGSSLVISNLEENTYDFEFYFESIINSYFIENSAKYTNSGKFIKSTTDTLLNKTTYDVDETTGLTNSIENAKGNTTYYTYNNRRQLTSVSMENNCVNYEYNIQTLLSKISQGLREYNIIYDEFLNVKSINVGNDITLITNNYEENNGNLLSFIYGNNQTIAYEYDEFNRIRKITKMDDVYNYRYNNNGNLVKIVSNDKVIKYTYDLAQRLYDYELNNFKIRYGYDSNNNITTKNYKLDALEYNVLNKYNDEDLPYEIRLYNQMQRMNYYYDELGRVIKNSINECYNTTYEYVNYGKRTSLLLKSVSNSKFKYSYLYDKLNNITHIKHDDILENKYYYDEYNELISEENYVSNEKITYTYDTLGNILSKKIYDINSNSLINQNVYEYNNPNWKDQLTKFNNDIITYDNIGNPITIGNNITLNWINGRQLNSYTDSNNTINYKYNKDGIRTSKTINGIETEYYLEGNKIIFEKINNCMIYYTRNTSNDLIGFRYNEKFYYYLKNAQNDIIEIIDNNYETYAKYKYDSWGNIVSIIDGNGNDVSNDATHIANINPFRYRSYYYDKETKLYYLNSRYYNPLWGRFINADGTIGANADILSYNLYLYCSNNPIMFCDIDGKGIFSAITIGLGLGALVGVASQVISDAVTSVMSKKVKVSSWQTYVGSATGGGVSGASFLFTKNPIALNIISSGVSSFVKQELEKLTGTTTDSQLDIVKNTVVDATIGVVSGAISLQIPGVTTGRNSYATVFKSGITKITNDTAKRMSIKVLTKGMTAQISDGLFSSSISGIREYVDSSTKNYCEYPPVLNWSN